MRDNGNMMMALLSVLLGALFVLSLPVAGAEGGDETISEEHSGLHIDHFGLKADIDHHYAVTEITQQFCNPTQEAVEAHFTVRIPERSFISNFSLEVDGETYYAIVLPKDLAQKEYDNASAAGHDTALLQLTEDGWFRYSITVGAGSVSRLTLRYEEFLVMSVGVYTYHAYISGMTGYYEVSETNIQVGISVPTQITTITQPASYPSGTVEIDPVALSGGFRYSDGGGDSYPDLTLSYECEPTDTEGVLLTSGDETEGYFLHLFSPRRGELNEDPLDKEIIFALDRSGSMSGTKMSRLKDAFGQIVQELRTDDTFNLVLFDTSVSEWKPEVIQAVQASKDEAGGYIDELGTGGSTNINQAMLDSLGMLDHETSGVRVVVLLTDGLPTQGVTNPAAIRENVLGANDCGAMVFCLGFGNDVDFGFLSAMALENNGHAVRITEGSDASDQMTGFYDSISTPLLSDLSYTFPPTVHGLLLPARDYLYEGSELMALGRYSGEDGRMTVTVDARSDGGETRYSGDFTLTQSDNPFVERLWAYQTIQNLLDAITVDGALENHTSVIIEIAMEYGFVTPYTSLFIDVPEDDEGEPAQNDEEPVNGEEGTTTDRDDDGTGKDAYPTAPADTDGDGTQSGPDPYDYIDGEDGADGYYDDGGWGDEGDGDGGAAGESADAEDDEGVLGGGGLSTPSDAALILLLVLVPVIMVIVAMAWALRKSS